jgi:hypothetical protein
MEIQQIACDICECQPYVPCVIRLCNHKFCSNCIESLRHDVCPLCGDKILYICRVYINNKEPIEIKCPKLHKYSDADVNQKSFCQTVARVSGYYHRTTNKNWLVLYNNKAKLDYEDGIYILRLYTKWDLLEYIVSLIYRHDDRVVLYLLNGDYTQYCMARNGNSTYRFNITDRYTSFCLFLSFHFNKLGLITGIAKLDNF